MKKRLLVLIVTLAALGATALLVAQSAQPPTASQDSATSEDDLEEFVPTENISFDSAISLPVDI